MEPSLRRTALYCGRAPLGNLHFGHYLSYSLARDLQLSFKNKVYFQIATYEREGLPSQEEIEHCIREILSIGFNPRKTYFSVCGESNNVKFYERLMQASEYITENTLSKTFGTSPSQRVSRIIARMAQITNCFYARETLREEHLVVIAGEDQLPYFRLAADISEKMGFPPFGVFYNRYFPSLKGEKMSSSSSNILYLDSTEEEITQYIQRMPSKGGKTLEEHKTEGGSIDCPILVLCSMLFPEGRYEILERQYLNGNILTSEIKSELTFEMIRISNVFKRRYVEGFESIKRLK